VDDFGDGMRTSALKRLLGPLADNNQPCIVFTQWLRAANNSYLYDIPVQFLSQSTDKTNSTSDITYVINKPEMEAAADVLAVMGYAGRFDNIEYKSAHWSLTEWSQHCLSFGLHSKTAAIIEYGQDQLVSLVFENQGTAFRFENTEKLFYPEGKSDYGLIYKTSYPASKKQCLVIAGLKSAGTEAAAHFFRINARALGRLFGETPFAILIQHQGDSSRKAAKPCWCNPKPKWWRRMLYPSARRLYQSITATIQAEKKP
jgi:hypothetical protein